MSSPIQRDVDTIAAKVRAARLTRGLTQAQVSALAKIDRGSLADIEAARRPPRFHQLLALHRGLKTKPGELLAV
jgi:transcriptional regulator with XRE-family HTH domain